MYCMMQYHLTLHDIGSQATLSLEKFVVLCLQILWTFM